METLESIWCNYDSPVETIPIISTKNFFMITVNGTWIYIIILTIGNSLDTHYVYLNFEPKSFKCSKLLTRIAIKS